jgi:hypothetical protein
MENSDQEIIPIELTNKTGSNNTLKTIAEKWLNIAYNGPISHLPHINRIVKKAVHFGTVEISDKLFFLYSTLIEIRNINSESGYCEGCSGCDVCLRRKYVQSRLGMYIWKLNTKIIDLGLR